MRFLLLTGTALAAPDPVGARTEGDALATRFHLDF